MRPPLAARRVPSPCPLPRGERVRRAGWGVRGKRARVSMSPSPALPLRGGGRRLGAGGGRGCRRGDPLPGPPPARGREAPGVGGGHWRRRGGGWRAWGSCDHPLRRSASPHPALSPEGRGCDAPVGAFGGSGRGCRGGDPSPALPLRGGGRRCGWRGPAAAGWRVAGMGVMRPPPCGAALGLTLPSPRGGSRRLGRCASSGATRPPLPSGERAGVRGEQCRLIAPRPRRVAGWAAGGPSRRSWAGSSSALSYRDASPS